MTSARRGRGYKITPPKRHGPEFSAEKTWSQLSENIREIQKQNACNLSFEENHRFAYNMVLNRHGEMLYNGVKQLVVENLETMANERIIPYFPSGPKDAMVQNTEDSRLLDNVRKVWEEHNNNMVRLGQILKYMDRVYAIPPNGPPTYDLGLNLFLERIMRPPIVDRLISSILNQIRHERDGYVIAPSIVKGCVGIFLSLQANPSDTVYKKSLQPLILDHSQAFYEQEGKDLLNTCDAAEFLKRVEIRFQEEDRRAHHYLSRHTAVLLVDILKETLLAPHLPSVISKDSGLDTMIDNNKFDDLSRLFKLCSMVPTGLQCIKSALKESIIRRGKVINEGSISEEYADDEDDDRETEGKKHKGKGKGRPPSTGVQPAMIWVQDVLDLKDKFDLVWRTSLQSNRDVESCLNGAFESFINMNDKCSEFISLFIDDHLKKGLKGKSELEVDAILDKTIIAFRFIAEKDVFEKYYKGHLSKRLLYGRSVSDDAERGMLAKLKTECGYQFTQKMEGMFNDMKLSAEATEEYMTKATTPEVELSVIIMTSGAWPINHSPSACVLPDHLMKACKSFEQFYLSRHSGRRISWQYSLGNADLIARFKTRTHELNVATFAMVILYLFGDLLEDEFLTYAEIKEASGIDEPELKRHLQSLACAKYKILRKHPPSRDIHPTDSFSFNNDFTCPTKKVKIATITSKVESTVERKETRERIDEERKYVMEACIVRIMKDRKHLSHNDLVHEVTSQLSSKFHPDPLLIKRRVEHLIEREYISRGEDRKSYNYIA